MASTTLVIHDGGMSHHRGRLGVLGIGTGNFSGGKYSDENGIEKRGATAGLWLSVPGRPEAGAFHRVHPGKIIDFEGYRILVRIVGSDRRSMYVRVELTETDGGKKPAGT